MAERRIKKNKIPSIWSPQFSGEALKWIGFVCVCFGTFGSAVVQRAIMHVDTMTVEAMYEQIMPGGQMRHWATVAALSMLVCVMTLPIYARLFYEGWTHTANQGKYLLRLIGIALVSEIPYDLAITGTFWDITVQNPIWAFVIAAIMLTIFRQFEGRGAVSVAMKFVGLIAAVVWTIVLQSYMGLVSVLLVACFELLKNKKGICNLLAVIICCAQYSAPFGMIFAANYDGSKPKTPSKVFYILYPAQLLLFGAIAAML